MKAVKQQKKQLKLCMKVEKKEKVCGCEKQR